MMLGNTNIKFLVVIFGVRIFLSILRRTKSSKLSHAIFFKLFHISSRNFWAYEASKEIKLVTCNESDCRVLEWITCLKVGPTPELAGQKSQNVSYWISPKEVNKLRISIISEYNLPLLRTQSSMWHEPWTTFQPYRPFLWTVYYCVHPSN